MRRYLISLLLLAGCQKEHTPEEKIRPVLTEKVQIVSTAPTKIFSGFTKAEKTINLSFRVGGRIEKLPIDVGEKLKQGQIIAQLDPKDFELEVESAQSNLEKALAEKRKTSAQYKRIKSLYETESASRDELDTARAAFESAQAAVEKGESELNLAQKQLDYTLLIAESDGCEIASKKAEINENVDSGETVATMNCGDQYEVEVAIPETEISRIFVDQTVSVNMSALPYKTFKGVVTEVGPSSSGGAAFPVTVKLTEKDPSLRSGMAAKVTFFGDEVKEEDEILVPIYAVGEDAKGHYVYIFQPTEKELGIAKKRTVTVGDLRPDGFIIKKGLKENDLLIVAGLRFLTDGKVVKLLGHQLHLKKESS